MSITLVYHSKCQASINILPLLKEIKNYDVDYIDIHTDKIETDIKIDVVPILILNNEHIFKGKEAFDKIKDLNKKPNGKIGKPMYKSISIAPPDDSNKKNPVNLGTK
tara:strand:- start:690 stop:1010 length:321 start_codon:yes stop_codon:yes gene_type:complete